MKYFLFIVFIISCSIGYSQDIAVYMDTLNGFYVFDAGPHKKLETSLVKTYKIGQSYVAYEDHLGQLKIYYQGQVDVMFDSADAYYVSKCFAIGVSNNQLEISERGRMKTLSTNVGIYALADSMVIFNDHTTMLFRVYYKRRSLKLEGIREGLDITNFKTSGNIIAYIDTLNKFKIFYHGRTTTMLTIDPSVALQYEVGQDVVAYINSGDNSFNAYWAGKNYIVEKSSPESFMAGNNFVAYVDNTGRFKIFTKGKEKTISKTKPDFYKVAEDIIVYSENNNFKAYYEGDSYLIEGYIPDSYIYDKGAIAYTDTTGTLNLFINGEKEPVTSGVISNYSLNGNLLTYVIGPKTWIYYKGEKY